MMSFFASLVVLAWVAFFLHALRALRGLRSLDEFTLTMGAPRPKVSIVIAVKDDEDEIEGTLTQLLNSEYPNLEIIVVNDRSRDGTAKVLERMAEVHPALIVQEVRELPPGWLGKVHALHQGSQRATGEFILFMDADMGASEFVISRALGAFNDLSLDHLAVLPHIKRGGPFLDLLMATSNVLFTTSARPWLKLEERPLASVKGVGKFNMLRRSSLERTEGLGRMRMEVADDIALAQLMAQNGGRSLFIKAGQEGPHLSWYASFHEMVLGLEKNVVGGFTNYKVRLLILMAGTALVGTLAPLALLVEGLLDPRPMNVFFILLFAFSTWLFARSAAKEIDYPVRTLVFFPLGLSLLGLILIRSFFICWKNGGITWSGTFYPLKELKAGCRVKLGL